MTERISGLPTMSAPIRVAIRADAGAQTGMGHFARASAVAAMLVKNGNTEILLVTDAESAPHVGAYFPDGTPVLIVSNGKDEPSQTIQVLVREGWQPEVLLVDQYGLVAQWEAEAAKSKMKLIVLDDLDAARDADVIVRPHGAKKAGNQSVVLAGPAYLPLSNDLAELANRVQPDDRHRLRVNICFGGSDPTGETQKAIIAAAGLKQFDFDIVLGPGAQFETTQIDATERHPHINLHRRPSQKELAELMANADLALGAGGVMLWERLCLGIPSLVISTAENQLPQIATMEAAGAVRYLGHHSNVDATSITQGLLSLASDEGLRNKLSDLGSEIVDGRGALRLAAWIKALALDFRDVHEHDAHNLLEWRTDERNWQHNWDGSEKPEFGSHVVWLRQKLADTGCVFRIIMRGQEPVGVVRFDLGDGDTSAYLSIYLVPAWHGQRMGLPLYCAAERALRQTHPTVSRIVSRIHGANKASERLHRDAGFDIQPSEERPEWLDAVKQFD